MVSPLASHHEVRQTRHTFLLQKQLENLEQNNTQVKCIDSRTNPHMDYGMISRRATRPPPQWATRPRPPPGARLKSRRATRPPPHRATRPRPPPGARLKSRLSVILRRMTPIRCQLIGCKRIMEPKSLRRLHGGCSSLAFMSKT